MSGPVSTPGPGQEYDVVVVGAGFGGLYCLHELRRRGFSVLVLEAGDGVGGCWYWNRYPGARVDVYSLSYSYSFSPELEQDWEWSEFFASQPELEAYANHVADRFDLRRDIRFGHRVDRADWDPQTGCWTLGAESGATVTARWVVWATGGYSKPAVPAIDGLADFGGEVLHAPVWPQQEVDHAGRRVGVVGTGASGIQIIQDLAQRPVEHLTVFQRTAEYAYPAGRIENDQEWVRTFKADYRTYRANAAVSPGGVLYDHFVQTDVGAMSDAKFEAYMRSAFDHPLGFYPYSGIKNLLTDEAVNHRIAEFMRSEVRRRVHDPVTAEVLTPRGFHVGTRRILGERGFYEIFNRSDVTLVDVRADPIRRVVPGGVELVSGRVHELDQLILATGFDSGTGALGQVAITGRDGHHLGEHWADGPATYLGMAVAGFPNAFMIWGPGSPSIRSQGFVAIEQQVDWLARLLDTAAADGVVEITATAEAEQDWTGHADDLVGRSLLHRDDSQYFGSNVAGKPRRYLAYVGGTGVYGKLLTAVADRGFEGFEMVRKDGTDATASPTWTGPASVPATAFRLGNAAI